MSDFAGFWERVDKSGNCWEWTGAKSDGGYGIVGVCGHAIRAHRLAWIITFGEIADGQYVLHTCDNRSCVCPAHLFLGTHLDNVQDMVSKERNYVIPTTGIANGRAKLTEDNVLRIRELVTNGASRKEVANEFGVSVTTIRYIHVGLRWKHITTT